MLLKLNRSTLRFALLLLVSVGFTAAGALLAFVAPSGDRWSGWLSILFFGSGIPIFAWQLIDTRPRLAIDDGGVLDRTLGVGVVPWREIRGAYLASIQMHSFICLELPPGAVDGQIVGPEAPSFLSIRR